jgi:eukaryotic-like serine/threonine-protein kinase
VPNNVVPQGSRTSTGRRRAIVSRRYREILTELAAEGPAKLSTLWCVTEGSEIIAKQLRGLAGGGEDEAARMQARLAERMFGAAPADPSALAVGRFELRELLGAGAMGVVYAAYDPELDRLVALKLLRELPGRAQDPERHRRLQREAKAMARLRHPNVVQVHEVGSHEGQTFVAMELIAGSSLREWLAAGPRPWTQTLELFVAAGHGLAAAHSSGLLHRDFKPDNVLLEAASGRVFVSDFGLARPLALVEHSIVDTAEELVEDTLAESLTQTGTCVGTPAYMAPEALGGLLEARADQFSFCASLYEALYGVRPFAGATMTELTLAKTRRELVAPTPARARSVPRWLRRIVLRGLAPAPDDRFASIDALLDAIEAARRRRRAAKFGAVAAGLVASLSAGIVYSLPEREAAGPPVCRNGERLIAKVWNPTRREAITAAFAASELPYASVTSEQLAAEIDRYTAAWAQMRRSACEATEVHKEQSSQVLDLRMRCLDRRRAQLDALLRRLERPTSTDIRGALPATAALTPIETCADIDLLESSAPLPEDPSARVSAEAIVAELDEISAAMNAGEHVEILPAAELTLAHAQELGHKPLLAEAQLLLGLIESRSGRPKTSAPLIEQAIVNAQASGHDEIAARAMISAVHVLGYQLRDFDSGERYLRHARAMLERLGDPIGLDAQLLRNSGNFEFVRGRYARAEADIRASLDRYVEIFGPESFTVAEAQANLAAVLRRLDRTDEALASYREALASMRASLGSEHPNLVQVLNNMAATYMITGQPDAAEQTLYEAKRILEVNPSNLAALGHVHNNLGEIELDRGHYPESLGHYEQAVRSWTEAYDGDHPNLAHALLGRGLARLALDQPALARPDLERALAIREAKQATPDRLADAEFGLARALQADPNATASERERALPLARRALDHLDGNDSDRTRVAELRAWLDAHE